MNQLTAVYLDFQCRHSYQLWRWLSVLPERAGVEVRPFSLDAAGGRSPWERNTPSSAGLELLALGELAREAGGERHHLFVDAAFATVHDSEAETSSIEAWLQLGVGLGLDLRRFAADSERWRAEVGLWHEEGRDDFGVRAVPTLVFDDDRALYVRLSRDPLDAEEARSLLDHLQRLSNHAVAEIRRSA